MPQTTAAWSASSAVQLTIFRLPVDIATDVAVHSTGSNRNELLNSAATKIPNSCRRRSHEQLRGRAGFALVCVGAAPAWRRCDGDGEVLAEEVWWIARCSARFSLEGGVPSLGQSPLRRLKTEARFIIQANDFLAWHNLQRPIWETSLLTPLSTSYVPYKAGKAGASTCFR